MQITQSSFIYNQSIHAYARVYVKRDIMTLNMCLYVNLLSITTKKLINNLNCKYVHRNGDTTIYNDSMIPLERYNDITA